MLYLSDMAEEALTREHSAQERLQYIPASEVRRVLKAVTDPIRRVELIAQIARFNTLYMINKAGSGHIGTSLSSLDIVSYLWAYEMRNPNSAKKTADVFFSSKGHDAPGFYALMIALGIIPEDKIHTLRRHGGLPGHPDRSVTPIVANTGSLGMGISKARGMARAYRMQKRDGMFYVMTGDGELQEGQIWESLQPTANGPYPEVVAIVDHNKIQSDTYVSETSDLGDLEAKFESFGWAVYRINGNDMRQIFEVFKKIKSETKKPKVIIADTIKGKGVARLESVGDDGLYHYHSGALNASEYAEAAGILSADIQRRVVHAGVKEIRIEDVSVPPKVGAEEKTSLIKAYSEAIVAEAKKDKTFIALDADLTVDLGLLPFKKQFPGRHIQAGIAEQDMVSFAGGFATHAMTPIVHSFACFLTPRANEQIYNNASERTKVVYVGGLAGIVPGMPGHSHQSVRDIAIMNAVPGLTIIEPADAGDVRRALSYALHTHTGSTYIRLTSVPWHLPFTVPESSLTRPGQGAKLRGGTDAAIIAYGPVMLAEAFEAALILKKDGISVSVYNFPWLNVVDDAWVSRIARDLECLVVIDNHLIQGGLGERIQAALQRKGCMTPTDIIGLTDIPHYGQNDEVLHAHGMDRESIARRVRKNLRGARTRSS